MVKIGTFRTSAGYSRPTSIFLPISARFLASIPHSVQNPPNLPDELVGSRTERELVVEKVQ
jgi:hypothetical protein